MKNNNKYTTHSLSFLFLIPNPKPKHKIKKVHCFPVGSHNSLWIPAMNFPNYPWKRET